MIINCCVNSVHPEGWVEPLKEVEDRLDMLNFDAFLTDACVGNGCIATTIPVCSLGHRDILGFTSPNFWSVKSMEHWLNGYEKVVK